MSEIVKEEKDDLLEKENLLNISKSMNLDYSNKFDIEDLINRRMYINDEIDSNVIDSIVYHILRYNRLDEGIPAKKRKPIIIYMNTPGGEVVSGMSLVSIIQNSITPIYTVNIGECCSMGLIIFISGHKRYSLPYSEFLLHEGDTWAGGSFSKVQDRLRFESEQIEAIVKDFILSHTKITKEIYEKKYRVEYYFLPEEGKKIGVVDSIVGTDCTIDEIL